MHFVWKVIGNEGKTNEWSVLVLCDDPAQALSEATKERPFDVLVGIKVVGLKAIRPEPLMMEQVIGKKLDMEKYKEILRTSKDDKEFRRHLKAGEADADTESPQP